LLDAGSAARLRDGIAPMIDKATPTANAFNMSTRYRAVKLWQVRSDNPLKGCLISKAYYH
jgi:hypothetical protein